MRTSFLPAFQAAAIAVVTIAGSALPCGAQDPPPKKHVEHVAVMLGLGQPQGGPSQALDAAMRGAHFDGTDPGFFGFGGQAHPITFDWGPGVFAEIRVPVARRFCAGLLFTDPSRGSVTGYNPGARYLDVDYLARTVAPVILFRLLPVVHVGIGPGFTRAVINSGLDNQGTREHTKTGAVVLVDLETPTFAHLSGVLHVEYQRIGSVVAGPYDVVGIFDRQSVTFPATSLNLDHGFIGAGLAVRF
jgi:hypothetical protein